MKHRVLKVHPGDNVLVALQDLAKGEKIIYNNEEYLLKDDIKAKHKFFTQDMHKDDKIIMYGVLVGKTQYDVPAGGLMTTDNTHHAAENYQYRPYHYSWSAPDVSKFKN